MSRFRSARISPLRCSFRCISRVFVLKANCFVMQNRHESDSSYEAWASFVESNLISDNLFGNVTVNIDFNPRMANEKKGSRKINEIVNNNWWRYDSVHNQSLRLIPSQAVNRMYPVRKNNQKRRLSMSSIGIARLSARCFVARERSLKGSRCATQDQGDVVITRCHNSL